MREARVVRGVNIIGNDLIATIIFVVEMKYFFFR